MADLTPVEDMLKAFQDYYDLKYSQYVANEIRDWFGTMRREYARELYREVKRVHSRTYRSLPDIAILNTAALNIPTPEQMQPAQQAIEQTQYKQLADSHSEQQKQSGGYSVDDAIQRERDRVRDRVRRGNASDYESWWLYTMEHNGAYLPMPSDWSSERYAELAEQS